MLFASFSVLNIKAAACLCAVIMTFRPLARYIHNVATLKSLILLNMSGRIIDLAFLSLWRAANVLLTLEMGVIRGLQRL